MLHGFKDPRYSILVILDNDNGHCLDRLKQRLREEHPDPFLIQKTGHEYAMRSSGTSRVFIYPATLTSSVKETIDKNPNFFHGNEELTLVFEEFLSSAPPWVEELKEFLLS
jgi:hypothetical protein